MEKPALILLHGALGAASQFQPWKATLEEHFELFIPELEGHGGQPFADRPFRIEHFAENLREFVHQHNLTGAMIFGYSMGGYIALYESVQSPGIFSKVFTFATKFGWNPESAAQESKMLNPGKIQEKVPHFAKALEDRHFGNNWQDHLNKTAELMIDLGNNPRLNEAVLSQVNVPCRIGVGEKDRMVSEAETRWAADHIPRSQFLQLSGTPHPIEKISLETLLPEILNFFTNY